MPSPSPWAPQRTSGTGPARLLCILILAGWLGLTASGRAGAEAIPIALDGLFSDWTGAVEMTDATGDDGASGIDFVEFDFANDDDWLFVRFQTTVDVLLQESNNLVLYLDTDVNAATGLSINGIGADLSWRFGDRQGTWHPTGTTVFQGDLSLRQLPTVTGSEFEMSMRRDSKPNGSADLFPGPTFRALLVDTGGDQVPDNGMTVSYTFDATPVGGPTPTPLDREMPGDVRVVTWNSRDLEGGALWNSTASAAADRLYSALDPNILCFQEIYNASAAQTAALVETWLPSGPGESWEARESNDNKIVTRYPILGSWALDGNLAVHLDTTADWGAEAVIVSAHLPCCSSGDAGRQDEIDHIMSFLRDAMTPGGTLDVASGTVFVITGDLNLVGSSQQLTTLLTGDIVDNGTYGADFDPDWDGSALTDARSLQSEARFAYTWRNDNSSYNPGRLDFVIFNDSAVEMGRHFALYTPEMSPTQLSMYGLQVNDVVNVSDHLPSVVDLRQVVPVDVGPPERSGGGARLEGMQSTAEGVRFALVLDESARADVSIYDVRGHRMRQLRDLSAAPLSAGRHRMLWAGDTDTGREASTGVYLVRVFTRFASGLDSETAGKLLLLR